MKLEWNPETLSYECIHPNGKLTIVDKNSFVAAETKYLNYSFNVTRETATSEQILAAHNFLQESYNWDEGFKVKVISIKEDSKENIATAIFQEFNHESNQNNHWYTDGETVIYCNKPLIAEFNSNYVRVDYLINKEDQHFCKLKALDDDHVGGSSWIDVYYTIRHLLTTEVRISVDKFV